jgi:hypothetical protein
MTDLILHVNVRSRVFNKLQLVNFIFYHLLLLDESLKFDCETLELLLAHAGYI